MSDLLTEYEDAPGVGLNRYNFGTSGHRTRPPGLVIENFVMRAGPRHNAIKTIVDPKRTSHSWGGHNFAFVDGVAVDELHRPLDSAPPGAPPGVPSWVGAYTPSFTLDRLRINHYPTKSEEELRTKDALPRPDTGELRKRRLRDPEQLQEYLDRYNSVRDEDIKVYLPALRTALARREAQTLDLT